MAEPFNPRIDPDLKGKVKLALDEILLLLKDIGDLDPLTAYNDDGTMRKLSEMPEGTRRAIASIQVRELNEWRAGTKVTTGQITEIRFWSKTSALELLGRNLKAFVDKVEWSADDKLSELLSSAYRAGSARTLGEAAELVEVATVDRPALASGE